MKHTRTCKFALTVISIFIFAQFFCLADEPAPGCIVIYGDSRTGDTVHEQIADAIIKTRPKTVFHTGDIVDDGLMPEDWIIPMQIISRIRASSEFFPALGNHEKSSPLFFENFSLPNNGRWYSLDRQGIHFIVLDAYSKIEAGSVQYKWLENDLKKASYKSDFIIVILHDPIFSTGYHYKRGDELRPILVPLFEKYGVDIVFSGHDHDYERSSNNNIYYIVTGGGGAFLYGQEVERPYSQFFIREHHFCHLCRKPDKLVVKAYDIYFNILDEFTVNKKVKAMGAAPQNASLQTSLVNK